MSKLLTLFASALALVAPVAASAGTRPATAAKNIVLVHGAWADGSGWRGVYNILKKDGYNVTMVANPDSSIADDVAATNRVLDRQDGATILVGHSYGGVVITEAGIHPKVTGLVYIAAFAPDVGESAFQFLPSDGPPPFTVSADGFAFLNKDAFLGGFAPDVPLADREFMYDSQLPIAVICGTTPLKNAAWKTKPSWFLVASNDHIIPPAVQRTFATRMKATTAEQASSHVGFVADPVAAARMIEDAAQKAGK